MMKSLARLFLDHPREVEESYFEHMGAASSYGFRLLGAAAMAFLHAIVPGVCKTAASDRVKTMADELNGRALTARETRMREAGAIDPGL